MDLNTTAFNIDELITSYIDNQISDPALRKQVEDMIAGDARLNSKYKTELLTKNLLQSRIKQAELSDQIYLKITSSINTIVEQHKQSYNSEYSVSEYRDNYWRYLVEMISAPLRIGKVPVPRYAFAIFILFIAVPAFFIMNSKESKIKNPYVLAGTEKSIMVQAVNEFHNVLDGKCKVQYKSSNAAEVQKYVNDNANFKAYVPNIDNYSLTGCMLNEYNGRKLAHLIYISGDDIIYIYQTNMDAIIKNELDLPEQVRDEIIAAKYYMCDEVDDINCTMTLWFKDNVVCASITTMPKQDMYNTFTSFIK